MSVSSLGNMHFVNQNSPAVSQVHSNNQARFDLQSTIATEIFTEEKENIREVRETEEIYHIDPESEHKEQNSKQEHENDSKDKETKENKNISEDFVENREHIVDIEV